jgi:ATP-dependent DNA ligase
MRHVDYIGVFGVLLIIANIYVFATHSFVIRDFPVVIYVIDILYVAAVYKFDRDFDHRRSLIFSIFRPRAIVNASGSISSATATGAATAMAEQPAAVL